MRLETERLVLRKISRKDLDSVFNIYSGSKDYFKYTRIPYPYKEKDAAEFIKKVLKGYRDKQRFYLAIIEKHTNKFIGSISLNKIFFEDNYAELGYSVGKEHSGKAYVTEATSAFIDYVFSKFSLNRIEIRVAINNIASRKIAEKLGAKKEGILRESLKSRIGYLDINIFSILKKEWKKKTKYKVIK